MKKDKLKCKYIFDSGYNPKYINGAYGGVSSRGEIVVNFYLERAALPNSQTYLVGDDNIQEEVIDEREPKDHTISFVRVIENGIILDYKNAKEIHRWLGEHIEKLEEAFTNE